MWLHVIGVIGLALTTATLQGFEVGTARWIAAGAGGPAIGLALAVMLRIVIPVSLRRWTFWSAAAALGLTALGAQCAMCVLVW